MFEQGFITRLPHMGLPGSRVRLQSEEQFKVTLQFSKSFVTGVLFYNIMFVMCLVKLTFFYIPGPGCHQWGAKNLPFAGGSHRQKTRKQKFIHTHIHITTVLTLISTPGSVLPDKVSAF